MLFKKSKIFFIKIKTVIVKISYKMFIFKTQSWYPGIVMHTVQAEAEKWVWAWPWLQNKTPSTPRLHPSTKTPPPNQSNQQKSPLGSWKGPMQASESEMWASVAFLWTPGIAPGRSHLNGHMKRGLETSGKNLRGRRPAEVMLERDAGIRGLCAERGKSNASLGLWLRHDRLLSSTKVTYQRDCIMKADLA